MKMISSKSFRAIHLKHIEQMNSKTLIVLLLKVLDIIVGDESTPAGPLKECGTLCDSARLDAITELSVDGDPQFNVLIIRDHVCAWVLDLNNPATNKEYGRVHHFKYNRLQTIFTIFDDPTSSKLFNMTVLFSSGMVGEVWRSVNGVIDKLTDGPLPLKNLGHNMIKSIDGSFGLQTGYDNPVVRIIQSNYSMTYDLTRKKRLSGPDSLIKDYSFDTKKLGDVKATFRRNNDIYFLTDYYYYVWKSNDGKIGTLESGKSITKDLYQCKASLPQQSTPAWPFKVPITTRGTPIPMITDDYLDGTEGIDDSKTSKEVSDDSDLGIQKVTTAEVENTVEESGQTLIENNESEIASEASDFTSEESVTETSPSSPSTKKNKYEGRVKPGIVPRTKVSHSSCSSVSTLTIIIAIIMSSLFAIHHN